MTGVKIKKRPEEKHSMTLWLKKPVHRDLSQKGLELGLLPGALSTMILEAITADPALWESIRWRIKK